MIVKIIVVFVAFLVAVIDKVSSKPPSERKGIWKKLRLENVVIVLLGFLLTFQIVESILASKKEKKKEVQSTQTFENILTTQEKIGDANRLLDSILSNLRDELDYTQKEFRLISDLNQDIGTIRLGIEKSITEYQNLNSQYKRQLLIEREKVEAAKPDVRVLQPKSIFDSTTVSYQFQLSNYGKRVADSVEFEAAMVLIDKELKFSKVTPIKTNKSAHNALSLPPDQGYNYISNASITSIEEATKYQHGLLMVRYKYYDQMTCNSQDLI